jgi:hypothetical protein
MEGGQGASGAPRLRTGRRGSVRRASPRRAAPPRPRAPRDVAFAHGGHLFAAANGVSVGVYNAYTAESVGNLRGHNGKVRPARAARAVQGGRGGRPAAAVVASGVAAQPPGA